MAHTLSSPQQTSNTTTRSSNSTPIRRTCPHKTSIPKTSYSDPISHILSFLYTQYA